MERRIESRFPVRSTIRVIVPGTPARVLSCELIDVSGTGLRFLATQSLGLEEIVAVEVDHQLILAEIRYCQPRSDKFVVGVRRLHEIAKSAELTDSAACVTEMIWDLHRHISAKGERDSTLAMKALEKIVEKGEVQESVESYQAPLPMAVSGDAPAAPVPSQNENIIDVEPEVPPVLEAVAMEPVAQPLNAAEAQTEDRLEVFESEFVDVEPALEPVNIAEPLPVDRLEAIRSDVAAVEPEAPPALEPVAEPVNIAEPPTVDLLEAIRSDAADPEPEAPPVAEPVAQPVNITKPPTQDLLEAIRSAEMDAHVLAAASSGSKKPSRSWKVPLALAAALVLAAVLAVTLIERRTEAKAPAPAVPAETKTASAPAATVTPTAPAAAAPEAPPATSASAVKGAHHVRITMLAGSWISIAADGKLYQRTLQAGDIHEFEFSEKAILRLGNAPGVQITFDDTQLAPLRSSVRTLQLGPEGVLLNPPSSDQP